MGKKEPILFSNLSNVNEENFKQRVINVVSDSDKFASTSLENVSDCTLLERIRRIDGAGSGIDSDYVRGLEAAPFGAWYMIPQMPTDRGLAARGKYNTTIHVISGKNTSGLTIKNERYNIEFNSWSSFTNILTGRYGTASQTIGSHIYVAGGTSSTAITNINEAYSTMLDSWSTKASQPTGQSNAPAGIAYNNTDMLYTIGGRTSDGVTNINQVYHPYADNWSADTNMMYLLEYVSGARYDTWFYVFGGKDNTGVTQSWNQLYNCITKSWANRAHMIQSLYGTSADTYNTYIIVSGGNNSSSTIYGASSYSIITDDWHMCSNMIVNVQHHATSIYGKFIYKFGGFTGSTSQSLSEKFYVYSVLAIP